MATVSSAGGENAGIVPALKARPRLQSAPDVMLKTPLTGKKFNFNTPQVSRKGLGAFNKITTTPAINRQEKSQKTQETEVKCVTQTNVEEYPDIEKSFPYDPLDFEKEYMPEYVVPLGCLRLSGLASYPNMPCIPEDNIKPSFEETTMSPLEMPESPDHCAELDAFLQTINELTIDFPPECD